VSTGQSRTQNRPSGEKAGSASLLVGVTGGIGSGKSAVCREFERLGRMVLSADGIARELTENDGEVREEISTVFGPAVFAADGSLKRKEVADIVFHNRELREKLNAIIHPRVFTRIDTMLSHLPPAARHPYTVIEAALIFESGMDRWLDCTIVVDAPEELRIGRVMKRDGCSREEVLARIASQMSAHRKREKADFVLENNDALSTLASNVAFLDRLLASMRSGPSAKEAS
jgi:dephospho-CoA kinase